MTQCVCYNEATKENKTEKENKMNGTMKRENFESFGIQNEIVSDNCKLSGFSMAAVAGGILLCIGIVVYAILTH